MTSLHRPGLALAAALAALPAALPAIAQTTAAPGNGGAPAMGTTGAAPGAGAMTGAMMHSPVVADNGDIRASKVLGSAVYNDKNEKLGSVDEILLNKDDKAEQAVIAVGGVLGVGAKLVAVPFEKLQFSDAVDSKTARVMMPGATVDALNGMPAFHYASK